MEKNIQLQTNIQCYETEMPSIVKNLFIDKNVRNIYVESVGKGYYRIEANVSIRRINSCTRCGGNWLQRKDGTPKRCPLCTSPYWNKPRISELQGKHIYQMPKGRAKAEKGGKGDGKTKKSPKTKNQ